MIVNILQMYVPSDEGIEPFECYLLTKFVLCLQNTECNHIGDIIFIHCKVGSVQGDFFCQTFEVRRLLTDYCFSQVSLNVIN